jgi:hypothetical protein
MEISRIRIITASLIVASAVAFAVGAAAERSGEHHEARPAATATAPSTDAGHDADTDTNTDTDSDGGQAPAVGHNDGDTSSTTEGAVTEVGAHSEDVLGINPESTPLVLAAVIGSIALAVALLLFGSPLLAAFIGLAAAAFAALDVREVVHQFGESHSGIAALAIVVTVLHLLGAGGAFTAARTATRGRVA